ncbi:pilus assembly protein PapD [Vibrio galatheae]|uniref:Pilus assembly protein PapD n=1 Tax=Vibrio galatheae TaxID=579748 RepID=A0A0F4NJ82_9VIBR|nr:fimbria/pilus periplasmic chaperone [Vibrio galatheae]KJY82964.1 pilus assembly protein PapD [Vibrio galatheae]
MSFARYLFFSLICFTSFSTLAGVVISNTRVIYPEQAKEVTVKLSNMGESPVLIQSWIDNGDVEANPASIQVPFTLTPPINRVDAEKGQTLRLAYTGSDLSKTQETVFWLNVLEVPAKNKSMTDKNYLQMAFRTRIKLFFRPEGLAGTLSQAANNLTWKSSGTGVVVNNSSAYHVSLSKINVVVNGKNYSTEGSMITPNGSKAFTFSELNKVPRNSKIIIRYINDYGAVKQVESVIK